MQKREGNSLGGGRDDAYVEYRSVDNGQIELFDECSCGDGSSSFSTSFATPTKYLIGIGIAHCAL